MLDVMVSHQAGR